MNDDIDHGLKEGLNMRMKVEKKFTELSLEEISRLKRQRSSSHDDSFDYRQQIVRLNGLPELRNKLPKEIPVVEEEQVEEVKQVEEELKDSVDDMTVPKELHASALQDGHQ